MRQAEPGEGHHVGLLLAPVRQRGRPLVRAPRFVGLLTAEDHPAVDQPARDRRQLARGDREHRLVHQRQAVARVPLLDEQGALRVRREREQVRVSEALTGSGRLRCDGRGGGEVTGRFMAEHQGNPQVAALHAVSSRAIQQPPCATEPALGPAVLAPEQEGDAEPEGAADRAQRLAGVQVQLVGALQGPAGSRRRARACTPRSPAAPSPRLPAASPDPQPPAHRTPPATRALRRPSALVRAPSAASITAVPTSARQSGFDAPRRQRAASHPSPPRPCRGRRARRAAPRPRTSVDGCERDMLTSVLVMELFLLLPIVPLAALALASVDTPDRWQEEPWVAPLHVRGRTRRARPRARRLRRRPARDGDRDRHDGHDPRPAAPLGRRGLSRHGSHRRVAGASVGAARSAAP